MYPTKDGLTKIETTFYEDTVWLSIDQIAELFQCDRSVIVKHVRNIFKEGDLDKNSVLAKFSYTATDGKKYNVDYYNLDAQKYIIFILISSFQHFTTLQYHHINNRTFPLLPYSRENVQNTMP